MPDFRQFMSEDQAVFRPLSAEEADYRQMVSDCVDSIEDGLYEGHGDLIGIARNAVYSLLNFGADFTQLPFYVQDQAGDCGVSIEGMNFDIAIEMAYREYGKAMSDRKTDPNS